MVYVNCDEAVIVIALIRIIMVFLFAAAVKVFKGREG